MSSGAEAKASREEEIAFLAMEQVLGVDIKFADSGAGDRKPDGSWVYPDQERPGIVEITSPPATSLMSGWARAKKAGQPQTEGGSIPLRLNELAQVCTEMLAEDWASENFDKLLAQPADERHLFLFARGHKEGGHHFYRLSDSYDDGTVEHVADLVLPQGISDVWFRGRARRTRHQPMAGRNSGWRDFKQSRGGAVTWYASKSSTCRPRIRVSPTIGFPRVGDVRKIGPSSPSAEVGLNWLSVVGVSPLHDYHR